MLIYYHNITSIDRSNLPEFPDLIQFWMCVSNILEQALSVKDYLRGLNDQARDENYQYVHIIAVGNAGNAQRA